MPGMLTVAADPAEQNDPRARSGGAHGDDGRSEEPELEPMSARRPLFSRLLRR